MGKPADASVKTRIGQRLVAATAGFLATGPALLLLALPLPFVAYLLPKVLTKIFFIYLLVFIYGFALMADRRYREALQRNRWPALILGIVCMTIMYWVWLSGAKFPDFSLASIVIYLIEQCNTWFWLMAILAFGDRYLGAEGPVLRYARGGAYPIYILHQTVLIVAAYFVVQWPGPVLLKWLALAVLALAISVGLYDLVVRRTNLTRFLFGMRPLPRRAAQPTIAPAGRGGA